jgi:hypothetical protein
MARCFVIQPFDSKFNKRYDEIFKPAIEAAGFEAYRVDQDPSVSIPIVQIERGIKNAAACFAEISTDNTNVWFELGYAFACGKEVVMVCQRSIRRKFPFDIQHRTITQYDTEVPSDFEVLKEKICSRLGGIKAWIEDQKDLKKRTPELVSLVLEQYKSR